MKNSEQIWEREQRPDGLWIVAGEIDFSVSAEFRSFLRGLVATATGDIRLDLGQLRYLDSSGLAVLLEARRMLAGNGRKLRITAVTPQVGKLFDLTQVGPLFDLPGA